MTLADGAARPAESADPTAHGLTEDIPYTHRFVANSDTRKRFACAPLGHANRMKGWWLFYSLVLALFTLMLVSGMSRTSVNRGTQVVSAAVLAILATLIVVGLVAAIGYLKAVRASRLRPFNGAVLESGFGGDEMVFSNPLASVRLAYKGIKSVTVRGDFVFMQMHGCPNVGMYPRELLPDEAIDRILLAQH